MQPRLLDYLSILKNKRGLQPAIRPLRTLLRILSPRSMKLLMQWSLPHPLPDLSPRRRSPHLSVMRAVLGAVLSQILLLCIGIHTIEGVPLFHSMLLLPWLQRTHSQESCRSPTLQLALRGLRWLPHSYAGQESSSYHHHGDDSLSISFTILFTGSGYTTTLSSTIKAPTVSHFQSTIIY
jgi:hypothetical protein